MRRGWPVVAVGVAALAVGAVHLAADRLTREPPNYSRVEDGLWVGGYVPEPPAGVGAVLNLCEAEDPYRAAVHRWEPIADAEPAPDLDWLRRQVAFIAEQRAAGHGVYIHCRNGASRSGLVAAAYLMRRDGLTRDRALEVLRARRPAVRPNPAFLQLLADWERVIRPAEG